MQEENVTETDDSLDCLKNMTVESKEIIMYK